MAEGFGAGGVKLETVKASCFGPRVFGHLACEARGPAVRAGMTGKPRVRRGEG